MDRLRRLDALFAERVLGIKPHEKIACPDNKVGCLVYHYKGQSLIWECPRYTRSLDAAWEGLSQAEFKQAEPCIEYTATGKWRVWLFNMALSRCDHPAEALVLACLRAVGTPEEDLA